jgi:hypothetical protein
VTALVTHRLAACELLVPSDWQVLPGQGSTRLIAVEPPRLTDAGPAPTLFRANLVLTIDDLAGASFRDWQTGADQLLPKQLQAYQLIDLERRPVAGRPGGRRLAQHVVDGVTPVTLEQWFTMVGPYGYTLSASTDRWRCDALAELFTSVADALVVYEDGQ